MSRVFSEGFKNAIVHKALTRKNRSVKAIAEEAGIGKSTLEAWIRKSGKRTSSKLSKADNILVKLDKRKKTELLKSFSNVTKTVPALLP